MCELKTELKKLLNNNKPPKSIRLPQRSWKVLGDTLFSIGHHITIIIPKNLFLNLIT